MLVPSRKKAKNCDVLFFSLGCIFLKILLLLLFSWHGYEIIQDCHNSNIQPIFMFHIVLRLLWPPYLQFPHVRHSSMVQLSFAMLQTNSKMPCPAAFHNTQGLSTSAGQMPRTAKRRILKVHRETRPVRTEMAPPS